MDQYSHSRLRLVLFHIIHMFVLVFCFSTGLESATLPSTSYGNETDCLALLDLKNSITKDPLRVMSSWNDSIDFCSWVGVTCSHSPKRVVKLNLIDRLLTGSIPPSFGNLTHLTTINLRKNNFYGEIPQEIGRLQSLQYLNLSGNSFGGKIPTNISHCKQLRVLNLDFNELIGSIPDQLSSLSKLKLLSVYANNLTGSIPPWIGNFSSLLYLYLTRNNFQGSIPNNLGRLSGLNAFAVDANNLSGMVPSSIFNISSLRLFAVTENQLHGELPPNVGTSLPNLEQFYGGDNKFTGLIPASLSNASRLWIIDFTFNSLTGTLPAKNLGHLQSLISLKFGGNRLGSGTAGDLNFLTSLANCTSLQMLSLAANYFGGEVPGTIGNLSTLLQDLYLGGNLIHGSIPTSIENLVNLTFISVDYNFLGGRVPDGIGKLQKLQELYLNNNEFSGPIPSALGNLTSLRQLFLNDNRFEGSIPSVLGKCQNLVALNLSSNNLTGSIPKELLKLSSLSISLSLSNNTLTGSLPYEVGGLTHLTELVLSRNKFTGEVPQTLGSCTMLVHLHLEDNTFEGAIPQALKSLKSLEEIDFSRNNFSGQIPEFLGKLTFLKQLNLSHNDFEGELPKEGIFSNASSFSILGNSKLCGGIPELHLPTCPSMKTHSSQGILAKKVVVPLACSLALIFALSCFLFARLKLKKSRGGSVISQYSSRDGQSGISYSELVQSTSGFSTDNLIGSGSFGTVYKGVLPTEGVLVAVKVFNLHQQGASKSFIDECNALRSTRHRNLLKIITACVSIDNQGNDFKSLVFEFMANGSLDMWLHPRNDDQNSQSKRLSLIQRLNIAIDMASALDYLHNHCQTTIVHCDLKPSNVLLDEDMVAHVGDFGLAKFLLEASDDSSQCAISARLKGSVGYIPPEYGMGGQVSILGDIYSYGILLLEMFIGKRPTDGMFQEGLSIHQFTAIAMPEHAMDIVDHSLLIESEDANADHGRDGNEIQERPIIRYGDEGQVQGRRLEECLISVMQIGLSCSATFPGERMLMDVVANKLKKIKDSYLNLLRKDVRKI